MNDEELFFYANYIENNKEDCMEEIKNTLRYLKSKRASNIEIEVALNNIFNKYRDKLTTFEKQEVIKQINLKI